MTIVNGVNVELLPNTSVSLGGNGPGDYDCIELAGFPDWEIYNSCAPEHEKPVTELYTGPFYVGNTETGVLVQDAFPTLEAAVTAIQAIEGRI